MSLDTMSCGDGSGSEVTAGNEVGYITDGIALPADQVSWTAWVELPQGLTERLEDDRFGEACDYVTKRFQLCLWSWGIEPALAALEVPHNLKVELVVPESLNDVDAIPYRKPYWVDARTLGEAVRLVEHRFLRAVADARCGAQEAAIKRLWVRTRKVYPGVSGPVEIRLELRLSRKYERSIDAAKPTALDTPTSSRDGTPSR